MYLKLKTNEALYALLDKQRADAESYVIRTGLFLDTLHKAKDSDPARLAATANMVQAFRDSAALFVAKWRRQRSGLDSSIVFLLRVLTVDVMTRLRLLRCRRLLDRALCQISKTPWP